MSPKSLDTLWRSIFGIWKYLSPHSHHSPQYIIVQRNNFLLYFLRQFAVIEFGIALTWLVLAQLAISFFVHIFVIIVFSNARIKVYSMFSSSLLELHRILLNEFIQMFDLHAKSQIVYVRKQ